MTLSNTDSVLGIIMHPRSKDQDNEAPALQRLAVWWTVVPDYQDNQVIPFLAFCWCCLQVLLYPLILAVILRDKQRLVFIF